MEDENDEDLTFVNHKNGDGVQILYRSYSRKTLSKILCKWEQDSVISFFLYLDSVFKDKYKLVHNQSPV